MLGENKIKIFVKTIDQIVCDLSKGHKSGKSYNAFLKAGLDESDMFELFKLNLIDYDEEKPRKAVWIYWSNIKPQRIEWIKQGICIPLDCNEYKKDKKIYNQNYLQK